MCRWFWRINALQEKTQEISIFLGLKLKGKALPVTTLILAFVALSYYGAAIFKARENFQAEAGSDAAYSQAGDFSATMERLDLSDPYLFVKMEVDSGTRKWVQTGPGPEYEVFTASLRAKTLLEIRTALENVAAMSIEDIAGCQTQIEPFSFAVCLCKR